VIPLNVFIYLFFIVIVILYFTLSNTSETNCATTPEDLAVTTPSEGAAYAYKVFSLSSSMQVRADPSVRPSWP